MKPQHSKTPSHRLTLNSLKIDLSTTFLSSRPASSTHSTKRNVHRSLIQPPIPANIKQMVNDSSPEVYFNRNLRSVYIKNVIDNYFAENNHKSSGLPYFQEENRTVCQSGGAIREGKRPSSGKKNSISFCSLEDREMQT